MKLHRARPKRATPLCLWPWLFLLTLLYSPSLTGQSAGAAPPDTLTRANELHTQTADLKAKGEWREAVQMRREAVRDDP